MIFLLPVEKKSNFFTPHTFPLTNTFKLINFILFDCYFYFYSVYNDTYRYKNVIDSKHKISKLTKLKNMKSYHLYYLPTYRLFIILTVRD